MPSEAAALRVVIREGQKLRMSLLDMVELVEESQYRLPVGWNDRGLVVMVTKFLEFELFHQLGHGGQKRAKRFAIRIHVDEHEAPPSIHFHGRQPDIFRLQTVPPIIAVDDACIVAVEVISPAVKAAHELLERSAFPRQSSTAVWASIVIGLDLAVRGSHHDN